MKHLVAIAALLAAGTSHAAYRCTAADGAVSYQDAPCAANERAVDIKVLAPRVSVSGPAWAPHVPVTVAAPVVAQTTVVTTVVVVKQGVAAPRRPVKAPTFGGY